MKFQINYLRNGAWMVGSTRANGLAKGRIHQLLANGISGAAVETDLVNVVRAFSANSGSFTLKNWLDNQVHF